MKIDKIVYGGWEGAYRLEHNGMEMIVVTEIGPRIMSFRLSGGSNILFDQGETYGFARGEWRIYGGHRFWIGPEAEHSFVPDNDPCETQIEGGVLRVFQRPDYNGLQKVLEISESPQTGGFIVNHVLRNVGTLLHQGAIWALTCVQPSRVVAPWGSGSSAWKTNMVRYWAHWDGHHTNIASAQWKPTNEYFMIQPSGEEGKAGLYSEEGFLANLRHDGTFIKIYDPIIEATYPDGGCNVELYTCKHFIEMETLSPQFTFHPKREYQHTEHWLLTRETYEPADWRKIGERIYKD